MEQQQAYRKIEKRLAIMKVLLEAGVIDANSMKCTCVSNAVNHVLDCKISTKTHAPNDIIIEFMELHACYTMDNEGCGNE